MAAVLTETEQLRLELWSALVDHFVDEGFMDNAEILISAEERFGLGGLSAFVAALEEGDAKAAAHFCDLITHQEQAGPGGCYNRLRIRRSPRGRLVILIDQPGNPDYVPPFVPVAYTRFARDRRRFGARRRQSRGRPIRRRGSRRCASRSPGGGDDDPGGEPDPAVGRATSLRAVLR